MQTLHWYLSRLARMSPAEVGYRFIKLAHTSAERLGVHNGAKFSQPTIAGDAARFVHVPEGLDNGLYAGAAHRLMGDQHSVFDLERCTLGNPPDWNTDPLTRRHAPLVAAHGLDYRDERIVGNIKYLWEPNRHLHLATLAQAYALTGDMQFALEVRRHVESWIEQCPYNRGANWASPLELGIRLINWSIAWQLLGGEKSPLFSGESGSAFMQIWLRTIYQHARAIAGNLSRFSSANNHLIGEAAGVCVASVVWPYWPEMRRWGEKCHAVLAREIFVQNAADGGNREQAFAYQQFVLDFLLLAGLAVRTSGADFEPAFWQRCERMVEFLAAMMDSGGNMPMIGDADDGYVVRLSQEADFCPYRSLIATGALLFNRPDLARKAGRIDHKTCWLMGPQAPARFERLLSEAALPFAPRREFPESGYYVLGSQLETNEEIRLIVDCGPLGYLSIAAHGHADALSFVLSVAGIEILVDPGTYVYHTEPEWRRYFRGTRAHNTVLVDEHDQSEQSGNFMWSKHATARCLEFSSYAGQQSFIGEHDGYRRLHDPVVHRRKIVYEERSHSFEIADTLYCRGSHRVARHWHFAEGLLPVADGSSCKVQVGGFTVTIAPLEPPRRFRIVSGGSASEGGWISKSFGRKQTCSTLAWEDAIQGQTTLRTRIRCSR